MQLGRNNPSVRKGLEVRGVFRTGGKLSPRWTSFKPVRVHIAKRKPKFWAENFENRSASDRL